MQHKIPAVFMRGGTSRAVFFTQAAHAALRRRYPQRHHPDGPRQSRSVRAADRRPGGGISSLSKAAIIGSCDSLEADVTFNFAQVDVHKPLVDWRGTCGNMSAAVGPFAIDEGLVQPVEPVTRVWVLATNTGKRYVAHVPVQDGPRDSRGRLHG